MSKDIWWSYWYFHIPNYAFAVIFYTLWARFLLGLVLPPDNKNYIHRWFVRLTDWFIVPVRLITPRALPSVLLPPIASFWIVVLRVAFYMAMFQAGWTPRPGMPVN